MVKPLTANDNIYKNDYVVSYFLKSVMICNLIIEYHETGTYLPNFCCLQHICLKATAHIGHYLENDFFFAT